MRINNTANELATLRLEQNQLAIKHIKKGKKKQSSNPMTLIQNLRVKDILIIQKMMQ